MTGKAHLKVGVILGGLLAIQSPEVGVTGFFVCCLACRAPDYLELGKWMGHRKVTHSLWFMCATATLFSPKIIQFWLLGFFSHIFLDAMTPNGVYFFWPFSFKLIFFPGLFDREEIEVPEKEIQKE